MDFTTSSPASSSSSSSSSAPAPAAAAPVPATSAHEDPSLLLFLAQSPPPSSPPALLPASSSHPLSLNNLLQPAALEDFRTPSSTATASPSPPPAAAAAPSPKPPSAEGFVSRVSAIPVVNSIASFYEQSKSTNTLIRLSATTVESSVRAAYRPLQGYVEPQLDTFGCQQLDKIQQNYPIIMERPESMYETSKNFIANTITKQIGNALSAAESAVDHFLPEPPKPASKVAKESQGEYPASSSEASSNGTHHHHSSTVVTASDTSLGRVQKIGSKVQSRIQRTAANRWNAVYLKSHESIQGLERTVSLVDNAQVHIHTQTEYLKKTLQQMQLYIETKAVGLTSLIQQQANEALKGIATVIQNIQRDIISTLKSTIDIISKNATVLPAFAQTKIKEFIMALPSRWAAINGSANALPQDEEKFMNHGHQVVRFADESSSILRSIIEIFGQYIERAKSLLENFRVSNSNPASPSDTTMSSPPASSPPAEDRMLTTPPDSPKMNGDGGH